MPVDDRSMATRLQVSGSLSLADLEMYRRKLPLTPQARVNGTFQIEAGRKYSPKGLLIGKYIFVGDLEENSWTINGKKTTFWRCPAVASFEFDGGLILDYEVFNISTFLASESIQSVPPHGERPIGGLSPEEKLRKLTELKKHFLEVTEQLKSGKYEDYYPVRWAGLAKKDFIGNHTKIIKTLTLKEFERIDNVDIVNALK